MGQTTSSLDKRFVNRYINFLLSATRDNSKVIRARVNHDLYNMLIHSCVQLDESVSEFIKKAIIERLMKMNALKVGDNDISTIEISSSSTTIIKDDNDHITRREFEEIENIANHKKIKHEIKEMKREARELFEKARRISKKTWKYNEEYLHVFNRNDMLRKRLLSLKKLKVPKQYLDDLKEIAQIIADIDELLSS